MQRPHLIKSLDFQMSVLDIFMNFNNDHGIGQDKAYLYKC